jgi:hypothetical protein
MPEPTGTLARRTPTRWPKPSSKKGAGPHNACHQVRALRGTAAGTPASTPTQPHSHACTDISSHTHTHTHDKLETRGRAHTTTNHCCRVGYTSCQLYGRQLARALGPAHPPTRTHSHTHVHTRVRRQGGALGPCDCDDKHQGTRVRAERGRGEEGRRKFGTESCDGDVIAQGCSL